MLDGFLKKIVSRLLRAYTDSDPDASFNPLNGSLQLSRILLKGIVVEKLSHLLKVPLKPVLNRAGSLKVQLPWATNFFKSGVVVSLNDVHIQAQTILHYDKQFDNWLDDSIKVRALNSIFPQTSSWTIPDSVFSSLLGALDITVSKLTLRLCNKVPRYSLNLAIGHVRLKFSSKQGKNMYEIWVEDAEFYCSQSLEPGRQQAYTVLDRLSLHLQIEIDEANKERGLTLLVNQLNVLLTQKVYWHIQHIIRLRSWHTKQVVCRRFRPVMTQSPEAHPQEWFVYAIESVRYLLRKSKLNTLARRREYIELNLQRFQQINRKALNYRYIRLKRQLQLQQIQKQLQKLRLMFGLFQLVQLHKYCVQLIKKLGYRQTQYFRPFPTKLQFGIEFSQEQAEAILKGTQLVNVKKYKTKFVLVAGHVVIHFFVEINIKKRYSFAWLQIKSFKLQYSREQITLTCRQLGMKASRSLGFNPKWEWVLQFRPEQQEEEDQFQQITNNIQFRAKFGQSQTKYSLKLEPLIVTLSRQIVQRLQIYLQKKQASRGNSSLSNKNSVSLQLETGFIIVQLVENPLVLHSTTASLALQRLGVKKTGPINHQLNLQLVLQLQSQRLGEISVQAQVKQLVENRIISNLECKIEVLKTQVEGQLQSLKRGVQLFRKVFPKKKPKKAKPRSRRKKSQAEQFFQACGNLAEGIQARKNKGLRSIKSKVVSLYSMAEESNKQFSLFGFGLYFQLQVVLKGVKIDLLMQGIPYISASLDHLALNVSKPRQDDSLMFINLDVGTIKVQLSSLLLALKFWQGAGEQQSKPAKFQSYGLQNKSFSLLSKLKCLQLVITEGERITIVLNDHLGNGKIRLGRLRQSLICQQGEYNLNQGVTASVNVRDRQFIVVEPSFVGLVLKTCFQKMQLQLQLQRILILNVSPQLKIAVQKLLSRRERLQLLSLKSSEKQGGRHEHQRTIKITNSTEHNIILRVNKSNIVLKARTQMLLYFSQLSSLELTQIGEGETISQALDGSKGEIAVMGKLVRYQREEDSLVFLSPLEFFNGLPYAISISAKESSGLGVYGLLSGSLSNKIVSCRYKNFDLQSFCSCPYSRWQQSLTMRVIVGEEQTADIRIALGRQQKVLARLGDSGGEIIVQVSIKQGKTVVSFYYELIVVNCLPQQVEVVIREDSYQSRKAKLQPIESGEGVRISEQNLLPRYSKCLCFSGQPQFNQRLVFINRQLAYSVPQSEVEHSDRLVAFAKTISNTTILVIKPATVILNRCSQPILVEGENDVLPGQQLYVKGKLVRCRPESSSDCKEIDIERLGIFHLRYRQRAKLEFIHIKFMVLLERGVRCVFVQEEFDPPIFLVNRTAFKFSCCQKDSGEVFPVTQAITAYSWDSLHLPPILMLSLGENNWEIPVEGVRSLKQSLSPDALHLVVLRVHSYKDCKIILLDQSDSQFEQNLNPITSETVLKIRAEGIGVSIFNSQWQERVFYQMSGVYFSIRYLEKRAQVVAQVTGHRCFCYAEGHASSLLSPEDVSQTAFKLKLSFNHLANDYYDIQELSIKTSPHRIQLNGIVISGLLKEFGAYIRGLPQPKRQEVEKPRPLVVRKFVLKEVFLRLAITKVATLMPQSSSVLEKSVLRLLSWGVGEVTLKLNAFRIEHQSMQTKDFFKKLQDVFTMSIESQVLNYLFPEKGSLGRRLARSLSGTLIKWLAKPEAEPEGRLQRYSVPSRFIPYDPLLSQAYSLIRKEFRDQELFQSLQCQCLAGVKWSKVCLVQGQRLFVLELNQKNILLNVRRQQLRSAEEHKTEVELRHFREGQGFTIFTTTVTRLRGQGALALVRHWLGQSK